MFRFGIFARRGARALTQRAKAAPPRSPTVLAPRSPGRFDPQSAVSVAARSFGAETGGFTTGNIADRPLPQPPREAPLVEETTVIEPLHGAFRTLGEFIGALPGRVFSDVLRRTSEFKATFPAHDGWLPDDEWGNFTSSVPLPTEQLEVLHRACASPGTCELITRVGEYATPVRNLGSCEGMWNLFLLRDVLCSKWRADMAGQGGCWEDEPAG